MSRLAPHRLVLLVLCLLGVSLAARRASAEEQVGVAETVEGHAEVLHAGASTWTALADGAPVLLGDQLRTQADAKLRVVLRGDSMLQVAPSSQLAVTEQLLAPTEVSRFELLFGTLQAIVSERYAELRGRFEVETPTAIAGVRGTAFIARYDPVEEETLVLGVERVTQVRARSDRPGVGEVLVGPGMATRVRRGGRPLAPEPLPEAQIRALRGATNLRRGPGRGASSRRRPNAADARRPRRVGEGATSPQQQAVDQPLFTPPRPKPPPPPPPIPPRGRR
jgi:ferric-dicitrate binding protein FerR (iron transport regulator)